MCTALFSTFMLALCADSTDDGLKSSKTGEGLQQARVLLTSERVV